MCMCVINLPLKTLNINGDSCLYHEVRSFCPGKGPRVPGNGAGWSRGLPQRENFRDWWRVQSWVNFPITQPHSIERKKSSSISFKVEQLQWPIQLRMPRRMTPYFTPLCRAQRTVLNHKKYLPSGTEEWPSHPYYLLFSHFPAKVVVKLRSTKDILFSSLSWDKIICYGEMVMKFNQGLRKNPASENLLTPLYHSDWFFFLTLAWSKQSLKIELHSNLQNEKVGTYSFIYSFKKYLLADFWVAPNPRVFLLGVKAENEWQLNPHIPVPDLKNWKMEVRLGFCFLLKFLETSCQLNFLVKV